MLSYPTQSNSFIGVYGALELGRCLVQSAALKEYYIGKHECPSTRSRGHLLLYSKRYIHYN